MKILALQRLLAKSDKWSSDVKTHSDLPEGLFEESAEKIAKILKQKSDSLKQAMSRLNFYINRGGSKISESDKSRLEDAKEKLRSLYGKEK